MPINSSLAKDKKLLTITITDRFDYALHQGFRDAYRQVNEPGYTFAVNLSGANYMDSSALGMVLLLKEHADKLGGQVVITQPHPSVAKILRIANFDRFVKIEN